MKLELKNLTKYYGKNKGVENINLTLSSGEIFGFIGPNGAGKSTTIRTIMQLLKKTSGKILIDGKEFNNEIEIKKLIGYLPSEINLYDDLTVKEMLDYHELFYKKSRRKELVKLFNLDENKKIEDLSLGNKKKLGIILAFMHDPKIIILDEPTSGLDPLVQNIFYDLIKKESKDKIIFYSTHILSEVSKICDKVGIIKNGNLIKILSKNELNKNGVVVTIKTKNKNILKELNVNDYKFKWNDSIDKLINILSNYKIEKILIEEPTLEDLFLEYYEVNND